jgi:hypothetical protein
MSVPLEGLATYDTEARVCHARIMAEYRRRAQEELEHIQAFQKQQHQQCHGETTAARPSTPSSPATATPDAITSIPAFPTPPGGTGNPLAAASATPSKPTKTPRKPSRTIKSVFSRTPKKKKVRIPALRRHLSAVLHSPASTLSLTPCSSKTTSPTSAAPWVRSASHALRRLARVPLGPAREASAPARTAGSGTSGMSLHCRLCRRALLVPRSLQRGRSCRRILTNLGSTIRGCGELVVEVESKCAFGEDAAIRLYVAASPSL